MHLGFGGFYTNQYFNLGSFNMPRGNSMGIGPSAQQLSNNWGTRAMPGIPFLATLNISDLSKITNDLLFHIPNWALVPTKLPSYIPKFEENLEKTHLITL